MTYACAKCGKEGLECGYNPAGRCNRCETEAKRRERYRVFRRVEEMTEPQRLKVRKK